MVIETFADELRKLQADRETKRREEVMQHVLAVVNACRVTADRDGHPQSFWESAPNNSNPPNLAVQEVRNKGWVKEFTELLTEQCSGCVVTVVDGTSGIHVKVSW